MLTTFDLDYAFVLEDDASFVPAKSVQPIGPHESVVATIDAASVVDRDWDLVNLGRCWDWCTEQREVGNISRTRQTLVRPMWTGCTHTYVISRAGAEKMLTFSMPHVVSVDRCALAVHSPAGIGAGIGT
jgi:hypothetical protein